MDFLNRAYSQLYDLYRSMTPGSRLTAGLLAAVVLLSVGYLFTHQVSSPDVDLMHGVPVAAGQLPAMEAAFHKANLQGYVIRGASIFVPHGQGPAYMAALADAKALPQNFGTALSDAIAAGTPFDGRQQREERMKIARQAELSLIIRSMAGIESAYVLYDVDSKLGAFNREKLITATASVKPAGSGQLEEARVSAIRHLVAGAIAGLKPENVTVSDLNGRTWYGNPDAAGGGEGNLYISLQRTYEQDLKAKILNALCFIPNVTVELSVVLDHERITRIKQDKRSPAKDSRSGRARTSAQQPNTATILSNLLGGARGDDDGTEPDGANLVSREQVEKESVGLTPTLARVSVGVPISYFKKIWQERNPAESGRTLQTPDRAALDQIRMEESAKIQKHVAQLLPSAESVAKAADLVAVTAFQDIPVQELPVPGFSEDVLSWLRQSWGMLGTIALALVSLLVLRSMVRHGPADPDAQTTPSSADLDADLVDDKPAEVPPPHARRFYTAGASLRDELSELVEDDPDAAANVLRNWIGHAG